MLLAVFRIPAFESNPRKEVPSHVCPASPFHHSLSNAAWSFARNINSILPPGKLPQRFGRPVRFPEAGREYQ